jgi:hypothetical protein
MLQICPINDIRKNRGDNPIQDSPVKESVIRLFNENTTPDTDSTETELTLLKFRLDQNQSWPHTRSRSQSRRTLVVSRHCFSSSDRRWPHTTTLFDANRSQSWAALSGLTEEKDAIFLLVSYRPSHINFLRNWSIEFLTESLTLCHLLMQISIRPPFYCSVFRRVREVSGVCWASKPSADICFSVRCVILCHMNVWTLKMQHICRKYGICLPKSVANIPRFENCIMASAFYM